MTKRTQQIEWSGRSKVLSPPTLRLSESAVDGCLITGDASRPLRICLLGATPGTGNLGVDALGTAAIGGLLQIAPDAQIMVHGWDAAQPIRYQISDRNLLLDPVIIRRSNKLSNVCGIRCVRALHQLQRLHPAVLESPVKWLSKTYADLQSCDVVLDCSAGDSFADIYGAEIFAHQCEIKELILDLGIPLILMPQTYGPFQHQSSAERAAGIMRRSMLVASREADGPAEIRHLCGTQVEPTIAQCPDMAFLLEPTAIPAEAEPAVIRRHPDEVLVGLNVSGLLCLSDRDFGLQADYRELTRQLVSQLVALPNCRVVLIPHVIGQNPPEFPPRVGSTAADVTDCLASHQLLGELSTTVRDRVTCIGWPYSASETKWLIGQCDLFIGARMHACIAAVSQSIPTLMLAYSKKAEGLMSHLGLAQFVGDLRIDDLSTTLQRVDRLFHERVAVAESLCDIMQDVRNDALKFFQHDMRRVIAAHFTSQSLVAAGVRST